ncbi:hypothetical protein FJT64_019971 [Amphibalanus amphitrite]|uniref:Apple domain-containing protein n=1 Tax=Amphibalanus amphitrite TaxID=1232801 RepID=A0A6A4WPZ8_AMPAM|nr:hypothetical protein FJT64_019971 [Amphibalanus amphitrite]
MAGPPHCCAVTVLLSLALLALLWTSEACLETAWNSGRMDADQQLQVLTIAPSQDGGCTCCAHCHYRPRCASLSFNSATSECELYSSVASYSTLQPDYARQWSYYVMPGRSESGQFCRQDSDCTASGDFCRGRFCTSLDKVTCRTVAETFGSIRHYAVEPPIFGWIDGKEISVVCWMTLSGKGYTNILWSVNGFSFSFSTLMNYDLQPQIGARSILHLAEFLRESETNPSYHISVWSVTGGIWTELLSYEAPRDEPVLQLAPRANSWLNHRRHSIVHWNVSMLWMPYSAPTLLTINRDDGQTTAGAMARTDGLIEYDELWVSMLE